jgi:hypothetical protein
MKSIIIVNPIINGIMIKYGHQKLLQMLPYIIQKEAGILNSLEVIKMPPIIITNCHKVLIQIPRLTSFEEDGWITIFMGVFFQYPTPIEK